MKDGHKLRMPYEFKEPHKGGCDPILRVLLPKTKRVTDSLGRLVRSKLDKLGPGFE